MIRILLCSLCFVVPAAAMALTVVADLGGESTDRYFSAINPVQDEVRMPENTPQTGLIRRTFVSSMMPIRTPELSPGVETERAVSLPGMQPLFLFGDDQRSLAILRHCYPQLKEMAATVLMVSVPDESLFRAIQADYPDITILPVNGSDLARRLKLSHYPVLVTAGAIGLSGCGKGK
ncbi:PFL_4695 family integrating conjugative element protein [Dickeya poaceiphila]|uniref:Integrating conjugative element protein n=1 Tax=Dickeya poaceiphila TaxID=568768 RepID=A0A5B8HQS7_9GAMM|nr:integrating conjugative element protein [Dickeya poaceiphila]QDX30969.1 integrating conjugative element protein [Dickeya poaceiphila]